LLTSALLNAAYFLPIIYIAFFRWEGDEEEGHADGHRPKLVFGKEADHKLVVPVVILAALAIIVGVWVTVPGFPYSTANPAIEEIYGSSVSGYKYLDENDNGTYEEGEPGMEGVTIQLLREGEVVATTTTGADGRYVFEQVEPGTYEVEEVLEGEVSARGTRVIRGVEVVSGEDVLVERSFLNRP